MLSSFGIEAILANCKFKDWRLELRHDGDRPYLQVRYTANCNSGGERREWGGRKWFLSPHMTKSEIVQTAFKACITAVEHEAREQFLYRGAAIFGPHFDVDDLLELCDTGRLDVRERETA